MKVAVEEVKTGKSIIYDGQEYVVVSHSRTHGDKILRLSDGQLMAVDFNTMVEMAPICTEG